MGVAFLWCPTTTKAEEHWLAAAEGAPVTPGALRPTGGMVTTHLCHRPQPFGERKIFSYKK